jgi:hypothetical protein
MFKIALSLARGLRRTSLGAMAECILYSGHNLWLKECKCSPCK